MSRQESSAFDHERINHINHLMDSIHDSTSEIYECLVDREFPPLKIEVRKLIALLKDIELSIEDDI